MLQTSLTVVFFNFSNGVGNESEEGLASIKGNHRELGRGDFWEWDGLCSSYTHAGFCRKEWGGEIVLISLLFL